MYTIILVTVEIHVCICNATRWTCYKYNTKSCHENVYKLKKHLLSERVRALSVQVNERLLLINFAFFTHKKFKSISIGLIKVHIHT